MKFFVTLALLVPAAFAIVPTSTVNGDSTPRLNPDPASLKPKTNAAAAPAVPETNAKRMARGLPPMAPHNLRRHSKTSRALRPRQSPGVPTQYSGILEAIGTDGGSLGYLSKDSNQYGEYEITTDAFSATPVSFSSPSTGGLITVSAPANSETYPLLGGIVGYSSNSNDIGTDSFNYVVIGGVPFSPEGEAKEGSNTFEDTTGFEKYSEATIWSFDPSTSTLSAQWINTDHSEPATQLATVDGFLALVGDMTAFTGKFKETATPFTFKLVPVPAATADATSTDAATATSTAAAEPTSTDAASSTDATSTETATSTADGTSTVEATPTDAPTSTEAATTEQATSTA